MQGVYGFIIKPGISTRHLLKILKVTASTSEGCHALIEYLSEHLHSHAYTMFQSGFQVVFP